MQKLYLQTYITVGNDSILMSEVKVDDLENWKTFKETRIDIPLLSLLNTGCFKVVFK